MPRFEVSQSAVPLPSAALGNATSTTLFTTSAASGGLAAGSTLYCRIPGSNVLKNRPFRVIAAGRVTGGTTVNFTVTMFRGSTNTSGQKVADSGAIAVNSVSSNWMLILDAFYDSTSSKISGKFHGYINATAKTDTIISNVISSVDLSGEVDMLNLTTTSNVFNLAGLFGTTSATNTAYVDVFEIVAL